MRTDICFLQYFLQYLLATDVPILERKETEKGREVGCKSFPVFF